MMNHPKILKQSVPNDEQSEKDVVKSGKTISKDSSSVGDQNKVHTKLVTSVQEPDLRVKLSGVRQQPCSF